MTTEPTIEKARDAGENANSPVVEFQITPDTNNNTVAGAISRARQHGYDVFVVTSSDVESVACTLAHELGATVVNVDPQQVTDKGHLREVLVQNARVRGYPGVIWLPDPSTEVNFEQCEVRLQESDAYWTTPSSDNGTSTSGEVVSGTGMHESGGRLFDSLSGHVRGGDVATDRLMAGWRRVKQPFDAAPTDRILTPRAVLAVVGLLVLLGIYYGAQSVTIGVTGDSTLLAGLLTVIAFVTLVWGFERYRSDFVKTDLLFAVVFAGGILSVVYVPAFFDAIGEFLSLQSRVVTMALFANIALLVFGLYLGLAIRRTRESITDLSRHLSVAQSSQTDDGPRMIQVVIPAYNEDESIQSVIRSLPDEIRGYTISPLVVSDGSKDDTAQQADKLAASVVEHPINQGQGGALKTGFEILQQNGADIVVTMDADGQHSVDELKSLVTPVITGEADYVMGSRYLGTDRSDNGFVRRAGIRTFTWLINVLTKSSITDCTNGYRAIRASELEKLTLTEERFSASELIIEARKNGLRMREVPITVRERKTGETKKPRLGYALGLARTILVTWLR